MSLRSPLPEPVSVESVDDVAVEDVENEADVALVDEELDDVLSILLKRAASN